MFSLVSCKPVTANSPPEPATPSHTPSPIPIVPTLTFTSTPQSTSTATPDVKNIADFYGVWTITRYDNPRQFPFPPFEDAEAQIGKKMELTDTEMRFDHNFLMLDKKNCPNVSYEWATPDDFMGHAWQALLSTDNPDKRDDLLYFEVSCDGSHTIGFEVTKSGKLVAYVGYWFFLEPESTAVSSLATRSVTTYTPSSTPRPSPTCTATALPTKTAGPGTKFPTLTSTPTDLELLDERTKSLFGDPASVVIDFFLEVQDDVRTNNKEQLARLVHYPITIHSIDGKDIEIHGEDEFVANYEKIATPKWKGVILAQKPEKLFTNWEGVMVHRGEMWFGPICLDGSACQQTKYYIYGITNDTPW
jgi:hypothetical protein